MNHTIDKSNKCNYTVFTEDSTFEWDPGKNRANILKHGVSFEEAVTAFEDEKALLIVDRFHSDEEERFILVGASSALRILYVCHCYRTPEERIRIISARKATRAEVDFYEGDYFRE